MELSEKLKELNTYPFHMPGHKRNKAYEITGAEIDITEIDGFDNLHNPEDMLRRMEQELSDIYGYGRSIISVNGSTCCILAAISAVCRRGCDIIIARSCHKSVYNACMLNELNVHFIEGEFDEAFGMYTRITQQSVDKAIEEYPDACAVVITSPSYEGFISTIKCPVPLIIDSAHGAHFGMCDYLPAKQKADIVIQSLHKTLPSLTQTAVIHINNPELCNKVKHYMDIFESSSPSYVLLSSIDRCIDFLKKREDGFREYKLILDEFYNKISDLENIALLKNDDITRIVLMSKSISGVEFAQRLRNYGIEPEGATLNYVILISTVCDTREGFKVLIKALEKINTIDGCFKPRIIKYSSPESVMMKDCSEGKAIGLNEAIGKISAEFVYAYPPAIPIVAPNEKITEATVDTIISLCNSGVNVISDSGLLPKALLVY